MADTAKATDDDDKTALAAIKLQSFVRASMCRAQVSNMLAELIDEMMAKKTAAAAAVAAQKKVDASVVGSDELPETSVHDIVNNMESPKSNKGKVAAPTDIVQEMQGSVRDRLAMFESPVKASPNKKKFWSQDNRGKELGDEHNGANGGGGAAMVTPDLSTNPGKVDTRLATNATRHVVSSQEILNEQE
ncbi:MAG: hypothetical protein SGARI_006833, partial [Bacillariaceae sp.]